eukprot:6430767-Amphidinium_carterae.1
MQIRHYSAWRVACVIWQHQEWRERHMRGKKRDIIATCGQACKSSDTRDCKVSVALAGSEGEVLTVTMSSMDGASGVGAERAVQGFRQRCRSLLAHSTPCFPRTPP